MSPELQRRLEELREDFRAAEGNSFRYFFCPILGTDEDAELCRGHIINQAFPNSPRAWEVQRADVDSFYGRTLEGFFTEGLLKNNQPSSDLFSAYDAKGVMQPKLMCDGVEIGHYLFNGHCPPHHTLVELMNGDGESKLIVFRISPERMDAVLDSGWCFVTDADFRIAAVASLIKAAHLAMFYIRGYRYALSAAGFYVGREILGQFFLVNRYSKQQRAISAAHEHFRPFAKMVRPIEGRFFVEEVDPENQFPLAFCLSASGPPFAIAVHLKTGPAWNCVLLPFAPERLPTFLDFINNDHDHLTIQFVRYSAGDDSWQLISGPLHAPWGTHDFED